VIVVQLLSHSPGLIDLKTSRNKTALHLAASGGHVKVVAELLARRPFADEDWVGQTPLFCAVSQGHKEVVDLFPLTTDQVSFMFSTLTPLFLSLFSLSFSSLFLSLSFFLSFSLFPSLFSLLLLFLGASPRQTWRHPASFGGRCKVLQACFDSKSMGDALFVANAHGFTPFDCAITWINEWAIEHFQWKLSIWSFEEALMVEMQRRSSYTIEKEKIKVLQRRKRRFREVMQEECERPLLLSLPRDCVHIISDYLFILSSIRWSS